MKRSYCEISIYGDGKPAGFGSRPAYMSLSYSKMERFFLVALLAAERCGSAGNERLSMPREFSPEVPK